MLNEFFTFLRQYNVVALGIAVVMGVATTDLVNSFVNNILMPIIEPLMASAMWQSATFSFGPVTISWGAFLAEALNFAILAFIVFLIGHKVMKKKKEDAKAAA